jgi:hypothetical protein
MATNAKSSFDSVSTRAEWGVADAAHQPDWLDEVVYARVVSEPRAEVAVIEAEIASPGGAELQRCAFAAACVAYGLGSFKVTPASYLVRFARGSVHVIMEFDDDAESWSGESTLDFGEAR